MTGAATALDVEIALRLGPRSSESAMRLRASEVRQCRSARFFRCGCFAGALAQRLAVAVSWSCEMHADSIAIAVPEEGETCSVSGVDTCLVSILSMGNEPVVLSAGEMKRFWSLLLYWGTV